ncbi:MAG: hypothetical protein Q9220_006234 [cf. Caloplaca sp. 1 TL-2023]
MSTIVQVLIPSVPRYVPASAGSPQRITDRADRLDCYNTSPDSLQNGHIISRYLTEHGKIGFVVERHLSPACNGKTEKIDVPLRNIYEHVTPAELERYEHHDWELEDERERNRPKVGRPRKLSPYSRTSIAMVVQDGTKSKKPLGRPRKYLLKRANGFGNATQTHKPERQAFRGVFIPSPAKRHEQRKNIPASPDALGISAPSTAGSLHTSVDGDPVSDTEGATTLVDQLTPSNARRVIGVRLPKHPEIPSRRDHRQTYSMVQAALGSRGSSASEDDLPESASEDELTLMPTMPVKSRFPKGLEIAGSMPSEAGRSQVRHVQTPSNHRQRPAPDDVHASSTRTTSPHRGWSASPVQEDPTDTAELLQYFSACKSHRKRSVSRAPSTASQTSSVSSQTTRTKPIHKYFQPKSRKSSFNALPKTLEPPNLPYHASSHFDKEAQERASMPEPPHPPTTPTTSRVLRQSMTPHFPSRRKSSTSADEPRHTDHMAKSWAAPTSPSIDHLRYQAIAALEDIRQPTPTDLIDEDVVLGSPITSSDEEGTRQCFDATSNTILQVRNLDRLPSPPRQRIALGSPMSSSSDDLDRVESLARSKYTPHRNGDLPAR